MEFRLSQYRQKTGMTQAQVANALGISQGLYAQLESGKRRMNETYLEGLARLYRVAPSQLIVDEVRDDPLYQELEAAFRALSPAERQMLVASARGVVSAQSRETEEQT
jgi:transcriptional regulator with XRE-family HTH domain